MAKIKKPVRLSEYYKIDPKLIYAYGAMNPTLNADTKLFIDPLLFAKSKTVLISDSGQKEYQSHFGLIINFLKRTKVKDDVAWKSARKLLSFPEVKGTCLGYGGQTVSGSGSGQETTDKIIDTAKQIVDLGIEDPDLFVAMSLFEEGFGPDHISDMATNIILPQLISYSAVFFSNQNIPLKKGVLALKNGKQHEYNLPLNPYQKTSTPIILVPRDVLRRLPIATCWSDVSDVAAKNAAIRNRINQQVGGMWSSWLRKTKKDKRAIREWALTDKTSFSDLLKMLKSASNDPYDFDADVDGVTFHYEVRLWISETFPLDIKNHTQANLENTDAVVSKIVEQFKHLIEERRLYEFLYYKDKPRHEKAAQSLFFAVADSYCDANNLDISPEADTGSGKIDFKVSQGSNDKVLVEIKLSSNGNLYKGYTKQLEKYRTAEKTERAYYVVLNVGGNKSQLKKLSEEHKRGLESGKAMSKLVVIDAMKKPSASKIS